MSEMVERVAKAAYEAMVARLPVDSDLEIGLTWDDEPEELREDWRAAIRATPLSGILAAAEPLGKWLSAALEDDRVCEDMKADIETWFEALK